MRSTAWILSAAVSATLTATAFVAAADAPTPAPAAATPAASSDSDTAALKAQIEALQTQLNRIEKKQQQQDETTATTAAVAADAAKQTQLFQTQPFTAGYNNGFKIQSADGNFVLQPGLIAQFRNVTNYNHAQDDQVENGFEFRRLRPRIDGVAFTKDLSYSVVLDTGRNVGTITLLDAWMSYHFTKEWGVKFGQFRNSYVHEGDVADTRQLAVERSIVDAVLAGGVTDRVQGVEGSYSSSDIPVQYIAAFHDGDNSKNTDFRDSDGQTDAATTNRPDEDFGLSGRVQYKFFGQWDSYKDFTAKGDKEDLLVAGGGVDYSQNGDVNVVRLVADAQYEMTTGLSAFGQVVYVYDGTDDSSDIGLGGQVGYLINPKVEVFGRYHYLHDEQSPNDEENFHEITAGANYYFGPDGAWDYNVKFTLDLNYLPSGSPGNLTGVDYLNADDSELVLRAQFQLVL